MLETNNITCTLDLLVNRNILSVSSDLGENNWSRIKNLTVNYNEFSSLAKQFKTLGVTKEFKKVIATFNVQSGIIPAGFQPLFSLEGEGIYVDLKRNISYSENGVLRPTKFLFSADSANPYEIIHVKNFIANLTCNPAIIYNNFINNPAANIGNKFKDRYEVIAEICKILGPGVDISIEVDDPFADESAILEEISHFEEILTHYRLVIKIPHTGPINKENSKNLLDGTFDKGYEEGKLIDNMCGHNIAYDLAQRNYRINFTLMFEPHQIGLALLAKPYFINTFIKQRCEATFKLKSLLSMYDEGSKLAAAELKEYMRSIDMLSIKEFSLPDNDIVSKARQIVIYRNAYNNEGIDGLDATRHAMRLLRSSNLPDTRLIICSMSEEPTYQNIDKLLTEPEFADMIHRVVITASPTYLARFASASGVLSYQRLFLKAAPKQ